MKYLRILYDWVLGWAEKPSGTKAFAEILFAEASFFPIPPDVLLIPIDEKIFQAYFK
tara:strand:- start:42 stop:212 length:171 start_codon:yes stop_codon:yes gene_type:complete